MLRLILTSSAVFALVSAAVAQPVFTPLLTSSRPTPSTLQVVATTPGDARTYDCIISNPADVATSTGALLGIAACDTIDFNRDGLYPDTLDVDSMLSVFSGGQCL